MSRAFDAAFQALTEHAPFPWQRALYDRFRAGDIPPTCDLPTGLGKTSVIAVWLLARAAGAALPRRLVYVVNRRTVVDQTTDEVLRFRANLAKAGIDEPLAISTLRGQFADNRAWSADPSQAAVICGTVDMIGSRLLFSGYRCGFRTRPLHAGLLGQDAFLIHDEAHLEPAFQRLLEAVEAEQRRAGDQWPLRVMELTATSRTARAGFGLAADDASHPEVARRLRAAKRLSLHELEDRGPSQAMVAQALAYQASRRTVLLFFRTVDDLDDAVTRLRKTGAIVRQLTGTMRGYERDRLVDDDPVFRRFLPGAEPGTDTVYLACTSAGEVGVNLSADHLVCDLSTFDSMAQRLGRLNRFGNRHDSDAHVFHPVADALNDEDPIDSCRRRTLDLLRRLNGDASPAALGELDPEARQAAFAPAPKMLRTSDVLFDAWALTTIVEDLPGRPPVAPFLHGVAEWQAPDTQVAWRDEVDCLTGDHLPVDHARELLEDYALKPHELLTDRTDRILRTLHEMVSRHADLGRVPVWAVGEGGAVDPRLTLGAISEVYDTDPKGAERRFARCVLLLSPTHTRPVDGRLSADGAGGEGPNADVADRWADEHGTPRRARVLDDAAAPAGMRLIRTIALRDPDDAEGGGDGEDLRPRLWRWYELPHGGDGDGSRSAAQPVLLEVHGADVEREAQRIVDRLPLDQRVKRAVVLAARLHDVGKDRRVWQRGIGNFDPSRALAKSGGPLRPLVSTPYRHELGSIIDAGQRLLPEGLEVWQRDLALHLIAAHHGRARPHFPADELFDPGPSEVDTTAIGVDVVTRFAAMQRRFGRWGLAYLESLVRAADYAASANPSQAVEDRR